jgi:hypothetical protein
MSAAALAIVPARMTLAEHLADTDRIVELVEMLDEAEELTPARREELQIALVEAIAGTRQKIDDTCRALASFEAAIAAARAEEQRLKTRREYCERQRQRLSDYALAVLSASGLDRIDGQISSLAVRLNPPSVEIADGAELPAAYLRVPPPPAPVPDKTAIARALKAGEAIAGCRLAQTRKLVRS